MDFLLVQIRNLDGIPKHLHLYLILIEFSGPDGRQRKICTGHAQRGQPDRNQSEIYQEIRGCVTGRRGIE